MKFLKLLKNDRLLYLHIQSGITKYIIPLVEIHVVNHCNLNCNGCSHFSNISDKFFIEIENLKKDLVALSTKFIVKKIALMGGEPLLHKGLKDIIVETKKIFPDTIITISTNGLLIPTLSEDYLIFFRDNNVKFDISKYPVTSDNFSKILDIVGDYNLLNGIVVRNTFRKYININGDSDIKQNYKNCLMKHCITLADGNLYHCPFAAYVKNFNKSFNQGIKVDDGINIKNSTAKQIFSYIKNPIETCRYCTFDKQSTMKWRAEEPRVEDWIL